MNGYKNNILSDGYLDIIKNKINELSDELLCEDIDILCKYIILRFLKTSPDVTIVTKEDIINKLDDFISQIWPFIVVFVALVNSQPVKSQVSELFGNILEDKKA